MIRTNTSLRERSIPDTLLLAKQYAGEYGITRVTNTTYLDNIGIPVYVSIRPDAQHGSLCVSSGKGLHELEAKAGAYMEGLELAFIEPHRNKVPIIKARIKDVLDGKNRQEAILDFCPKIGTTFSLEDPIECVEATDLISGETFLIPAELVFLPYRQGKRYFGSSTNGVSSGNSLTEASFHGILEVIERDIMSFQIVSGSSVKIDPTTYPDNVREIHEKVKRAGHMIDLRYAPNEFDIPFIIATLVDGEREDPIFVNGGYGCHYYKSIAMMRAATEAIQSRLAYIHGGRDDLIDGYRLYEDWNYTQKAARYKSISSIVRKEGSMISTDDISEYSFVSDDLSSYLNDIIEKLKQFGFNHILRVAYTSPEEPIQIIKIIIPKMEFFTLKMNNVGARLKSYVDNLITERSLESPN